MERRASIARIIANDYTTFNAFMFQAVLVLIYAVLVFLRAESADFFGYTAAVIILAALVIGLWRIRLIASVIVDGIATPAKINSVYFFRDRGRVEYVYTYAGRRYECSNALHRTRQTASLAVGDAITVMVDRDTPQRAFIFELYT